jgi:signal transduction histidine kinase
MTRVSVDTDFDSLAGFLSDALALVTPEGTIGEWSSGAAALTGITRANAEGRSLEELFSRVDPPLGFAVVPQAMALWSADENRRELHATAISIEGGWLISFGREQQFAAIEQLKNELLAAISHELRTPIATIKAFATTLRGNPSTSASDRDEYLTTIEEEADRLARAVDDLLLAGRVDAVHLLSARENTTVGALLDDVERRLGPTASKRLERRNDGVAVRCDAQLLATALGHLVDNAIKFSADGTPVVVEAGGDGERVTISVADSGIGIAGEHLPYIFERFYRVERNLVAASGGTGLGLFVANAIVRAHGGTIAVTSEPHQGSRFTITLPVRG